jgi:thiamine-phosphate pyrophosphorylase
MESYAIADCVKRPSEAFYERVAELVAAGVNWLQLRAKTLSDREVVEIGARMRLLIRSGTRFLVNGRSDIAVGVGAEGVHLPASGIPIPGVRTVSSELIVGRSCHSLEDCRRAQDEGADYVILGPVFTPRSKEKEATVPLPAVSEAARLRIPVFALGGMSRDTAPQLSGTGVAGIAAITLYMDDSPVSEIVRMVHEL